MRKILQQDKWITAAYVAQNLRRNQQDIEDAPNARKKAGRYSVSLDTDVIPETKETEDQECPWCGEDLDDCDCE